MIFLEKEYTPLSEESALVAKRTGNVKDMQDYNTKSNTCFQNDQTAAGEWKYCSLAASRVLFLWHFKKCSRSWVHGFLCDTGLDQPLGAWWFLCLWRWSGGFHGIWMNCIWARQTCCGHRFPFPLDVTWTWRSQVYVGLSGRAVRWWTSSMRSISKNIQRIKGRKWIQLISFSFPSWW